MSDLKFYHATLNDLQEQPLFARGEIPTVHTSLTYAAWYGFWLANMARYGNKFQVYNLAEAAQYLSPLEDGMFCVKQLGSFVGDDRDPTVLESAPDLFRKPWKWGGALTYVPAKCVKELSLESIRAKLDPDKWEELSEEVNSRLTPAWLRASWWGQKSGRMVFPSTVPDFLR